LIDERLEQLRSLEHLRALGEFSSLMVHEIRTPLTSLQIGLDLLQKDPAFDSHFDRKIGVLMEQVTRIDAFLRHVQDFAKPVVLFPTLLSTRSLLGSVVEEVKERFPSLSVQVHFREGRVYADPERLREVLNNILLNAAEAIGGEGAISIRVSSIREGVRISVKDWGEGMNPRAQKNAFQLFHTTKREGTGLGLPIVKKIMDLHGGKISLISALGRGTEVRLDFPLGEESRCVS
jgi:signal transduction histidine kinase